MKVNVTITIDTDIDHIGDVLGMIYNAMHAARSPQVDLTPPNLPAKDNDMFEPDGSLKLPKDAFSGEEIIPKERRVPRRPKGHVNIERLRTLAAQGLTYKEIAKEMDMSAKITYNYLYNYKIPFKLERDKKQERKDQ